MIILSVIIIIGFYAAFKALGACHPCNYTLNTFKRLLKASRRLLAAVIELYQTTARPDPDDKRMLQHLRRFPGFSCCLFPVVQNAQKPLFYRPDAVQRIPSKHMNISTYINTNYVKLEPSNSKIGIS